MKLVSLEFFGDELSAEVPDLRDPFHEMLEEYGDIVLGPHTISEDIIVPFIRQSLEEGAEAELKAVSHFLERMARSGLWVEDVLCLSVLDPLIEDGSSIEELRPYLRPMTTKLLKEHEAARGRFIER